MFSIFDDKMHDFIMLQILIPGTNELFYYRSHPPLRPISADISLFSGSC